MAIIAFQVVIVLLLVAVRALNEDALLMTGIVLSGLTLLAVFATPLAILQLATIWISIACLSSGEAAHIAPARHERPPGIEPAGSVVAVQAAEVQEIPRDVQSSKSIPSNPLLPAKGENPTHVADEPRSDGNSPIGVASDSRATPTRPVPFATLSNARADIAMAAYIREVTGLYHFTRAANLSSILEHGLRPGYWHATLGIDAKRNDSQRLDGCPDALCLSVSFPNDRLLHNFRYRWPEAAWVVMRLCPSVLWKKNCAYHAHNAADRRERERNMADRCTVSAFNGMFAEAAEGPSRQDLGLLPGDPTDVQAEVLVFEPIGPDDIVELVFDDRLVMTHYRAIASEMTMTFNGSYEGVFGKRQWVRQGQS